MGSSSRKCKTKKTRLQKKLKQLQVENNELKARLLKCEYDIKKKTNSLNRLLSSTNKQYVILNPA